MRKLIFLLSIGLGCAISLHGQRSLRYQELQLSVGTMNYNGEITTNLDPGTLLLEMGYYASLDYTHYFGPKWGMGSRLGYGTVSADDANHDNPNRGLSFNSDIVEWNGHIIYHFRKFGKYYQSHRSTFFLKVSGGATWVHAFYPEGMQLSDGAELYPGTNGGFNLGLGGGLKFRLNRVSVLTLEFMGHYLYSDLVEGFSLPEDNGTDGYGGIRIGYAYQFL
ncbi:MAG: hypothetical protein EP346_07485 [Bacteroidetes bacterium]|nr:MAG: hypothetical protein EP346_07485 [Bacteroidota bacterium]